MGKYTANTLLKAVLRRVFHTEWHKVHYLVLDVNKDELEKRMSSFRIPVKALDYNDYLLGDMNEFDDEKMALYKLRFQDQTYKAYGIIEDGVLVYSCWISTSRLGLPIETKPISLNPKEGYLEDAYCHPNYRGRGYHTQMNAYRIHELVKMGKTRIVVTVFDGNVPALKSQFKNGFRDSGTFYIGKLLGIKFNTLNKRKYESK